MEISSLVKYEALHRLELLHPVSEEPLGIVFNIRSAESDAAKKVLRKHLDAFYERQRKGKALKGDDAVQRELEKAASYIESWDWGTDPKTGEPNTYQGEVPELSIPKAVAILEREGWMFAQIVEAASNVGNFSQTSAKGSSPTSS